MDDNHNTFHGVNFASADYLGLAQNEFARDAAIEAATNFGVNSAGSPLAFGATKYFKF
jgi:7-keto-8-aminopelargonate synthetase-like enzyme